MSTQESSRLIKASSARHLGASATFNFDDLRRQCDEHVENARRQAQQLLNEATAGAEEIRSRAHAEGLAAGQRDGLTAAQQIVESRAAQIAAGRAQEELRTVLPAFRNAAEALQVERDRWLSNWESAAVKLSAVMAEKILRHELARQPELAPAIIREALQLSAGEPQIKLRLHPHDLEQLRDSGQDMLGQLASVGEATLVPDENISRGGCLIETRHGVIDARLETQLQRITAELLEGV